MDKDDIISILDKIELAARRSEVEVAAWNDDISTAFNNFAENIARLSKEIRDGQ